MRRYTCPCCGNLSFTAPPGSDGICLNCYWHDDYASLFCPRQAVGPNRVPLVEAQKNFQKFGAMEERFIDAVQKAKHRAHLEKDPLWRPIDASKDFFYDWLQEHPPIPEDDTEIYYWLPTYWLRDKDLR